MEATMVTDGIMIEINAKLAASDNYHGTALELGLVRVHMQGYRDGSYEETMEATNKAIKELYGDGESNGSDTPLCLFPDELEGRHEEYDWYVDETEGQLMGSNIYLKYGKQATSAHEIRECEAEKYQASWASLNEGNAIMSKVQKKVGGNIRLSYDWTQGKAIEVIGHLAMSKFTRGAEKDIFAMNVVSHLHDLFPWTDRFTDKNIIGCDCVRGRWNVTIASEYLTFDDAAEKIELLFAQHISSVSRSPRFWQLLSVLAWPLLFLAAQLWPPSRAATGTAPR